MLADYYLSESQRCDMPSWYFLDGYCDDGLNNFECGYDGGDCCLAESFKGYCDDCTCQGPLTKQKCVPALKNDGYCDGNNNNMHCAYDGGDCCIEVVDCSHCNESEGTCDCVDTETPKCRNLP